MKYKNLKRLLKPPIPLIPISLFLIIGSIYMIRDANQQASLAKQLQSNGVETSGIVTACVDTEGWSYVKLTYQADLNGKQTTFSISEDYGLRDCREGQEITVVYLQSDPTSARIANSRGYVSVRRIGYIGMLLSCVFTIWWINIWYTHRHTTLQTQE